MLQLLVSNINTRYELDEHITFVKHGTHICHQIPLFDSDVDYRNKSNVFVSALALNHLCMHNEFTYVIALENAHVIQFTVAHDDLI